MHSDPDDDGFAGALRTVQAVEGWLTDAQAHQLWRAAREVPPTGQIVEIGSFRGRSTIILAMAAREAVTVVAIDPHAGGDRGPNEISADRARGEADHAAFTANLAAADMSSHVHHVRKASGQAHGDVAGEIDLLYIDGAHRYAPAKSDLRRWGDRVALGGDLFLHDAFNAIGVTTAQFRLLAFGADFEYVGRDGSLAHYRRVRQTGVNRARNTTRQLVQLGYFGRMISVKCALTVHAYPVARLLGHPTSDWPY